MLPWYLGNSREVSEYLWSGGVAFLALWSSVWTGLSLWHAAKRQEKGWFIFFLLVHTAGILEALYLIFVVGLFGQKKNSGKKRR
jgi:hypothetical protein